MKEYLSQETAGYSTILVAFLFAEFRQGLWTQPYYSLWKTNLSSDRVSKEESYIKGAQYLVLVPTYLSKLDGSLLFLYVPRSSSSPGKKKKKNSKLIKSLFSQKDNLPTTFFFLTPTMYTYTKSY